MLDFKAGGSSQTSTEIFSHPRGIIVIAGTELWERVSFHGMQALLVIYMADHLFRAGRVENILGFGTFRALIEAVTGVLSPQALASQIFGLYVGLAALTPIFGGLIGDRVIGRRLTVIIGIVLITIGHFAMTFDQSFLLALMLLILGAGCLRGNLMPQMGALYAVDDRRRTAEFQIYYTALNLGAFIAPLITGLLAESYGQHYGFGFAGIGMLIGLVVYISGQHYLPADYQPIEVGHSEPLSQADWRRISALLGLVAIGTGFWIAQTQVWNTYNLWARDHLVLTFGSWTMPVPWLQAIDASSVFIFVGPLLYLWRRQAASGHEPNELSKMAIGCFIFGASVLWLSLASLAIGDQNRVPFWWAVIFHMASGVGYLFYAPVMISLFTRAAPKQVNGTLVGAALLPIFFGSVISGRLGSLYETISPSAFWLLHCGIVFAVALVLLLIKPWFYRAISDGLLP